MAKVTRIKAKDDDAPKRESDEPAITRKKVVVKDKKSDKAKREKIKKAEKEIGTSKKNKEKKPFILFRPFVALFKYLHNSWLELRQVRWPNRKATWKMVLAVMIYCLIFVVIISLLDLFFGWLFKLILG